MTDHTTPISYGNRQNQENTIRAVCDYIEQHPRYASCDMQDSAALNLCDARQAIERDDISAGLTSADRAARYVFGIWSAEYRQVTLLLGTNADRPY